LGVFAWLVSRHAGKLYSPSDFKNEDNYVAVVASLAAATARRPEGEPARMDVSVRRIAEAIRDVPTRPRADSEAWRRRILWVDDRPENNFYERQAFEALGLTFALALTTHQALDSLGREKFLVIISDMGRQEGPREGYALLDELRRRGDETPFFIYAGSNLPEHKREAIQHGAQGSTNHPQELFQMVMAAVVKARQSP